MQFFLTCNKTTQLPIELFDHRLEMLARLPIFCYSFAGQSSATLPLTISMDYRHFPHL